MDETWATGVPWHPLSYSLGPIPLGPAPRPTSPAATSPFEAELARLQAQARRRDRGGRYRLDENGSQRWSL